MKMIYRQIQLRVVWVVIGLMIAVYSIFSPEYVVKKLVVGLKDIKDV